MTLFFLDVTTVSIQSEEPGCIGPGIPGWCFNSDPGTKGCWVGNQVPDKSETFHFDTQQARDEFNAEVQRITDSQGIVGSSHPAFTTITDFTPSNCEGPDGETPLEIIGYDRSSNNDGSSSVIGYQNFMTGVEGDPNDFEDCLLN